VEFNLADLFESIVDAIPDREALVCGDRRLTYRELDERSNRLAHHLESAGIGPGDHVGLYLYNGSEYVESMLACLKIRAVPINVNYRYVEAELRYLFDNADMVGLIHQREFSPRIAAVKHEVPSLRTYVFVDDDSGGDVEALGSVEYDTALSGGTPERGFGDRSPDDTFIIYTGGTTGMPKGVVWRQEDLFFTGLGGGNPVGQPVATPEELAPAAAAKPPVTQFPAPPLIHGAAQLAVFIAFFWGDKVVLIPRFDAELAWDTVERERVNTMTLVGDAMARPMAEVLEATADRRDLSSLTYYGSTGALLSEAVKEKLRALLPNTIVTENFGATEAGFLGMGAPGDQKMRYFMNERVKVVDVEAGEFLVPGDERIGKVALRGRIPLGYYKDEQKTAETFLTIDGERWVVLGDMAQVEADGSVTVLGRGTMCINSGGEKIYPEEVEAALKSHPDVFDAVVVGVPDERWGEKVAALVQPREGASPAESDLEAHARTRVAGYKVPRQWRFTDSILRHPSGKPDYPWAKRVFQEA
jgi:3-oxocholest-4-en-26-oate---CoA ligase